MNAPVMVRLPWPRRFDAQLVLFAWGVGVAQLVLYLANDYLYEATPLWEPGSSLSVSTYAWNWLRFGLGGLALPWLVRRSWAEPFARRGLATQFLRHLARALAVTAAVALAYFGLRSLSALAAGESYPFARLYQALLRGVFLADVFFYLGIAVVASAVASARRLDERAAETSRLEAALLQAELGLLRAQVSPGFLFDALRAISALVEPQPAEADRALARLGEFLRRSLEASQRPEVSMAKELELLHSYLEVQRTRLGDRLVIEVDVSAAVYPALLPNLLLQSLVDTAIQHECSRSAPGSVRVTSERRGERLVLEVTGGDGWLPRESEAGEVASVLIQTRERLRRHYGAAQSVAIEPGNSGETRVRIELPWREETTPDRQPRLQNSPRLKEVAVDG